jgi:hypothetical protein
MYFTLLSALPNKLQPQCEDFLREQTEEAHEKLSYLLMFRNVKPLENGL